MTQQCLELHGITRVDWVSAWSEILIPEICATTLSIMTCSIMAFRKMTLIRIISNSYTGHNDTHHNRTRYRWLLRYMSFMLSATKKPVKLSFVMLGVVILGVIAPRNFLESQGNSE